MTRENSKTQTPTSREDASSKPQAARGAGVRWFFSKRIRQASAMAKHVQKILDHQRDILSPKAVGAVSTAIGELRGRIAGNGTPEALEEAMEGLEKAAN